MIRINLLPFRAARTKENVRRQVTIFVLLLILIGLGMFTFSLHLKGRVNDEQARVDHLKVELSKYKKKAREVDSINKKNKMLQKKIDIIDDLQKVRKAPVIALGALSDSVTPERMWITRYQESGKLITLTGFALDEITVADFTEKIEVSPYFEKASLRYLKHAVQKNLPMKSFEISCERSKATENASAVTGMKVK